MKKLLTILILIVSFGCKKAETTPYTITGVYSSGGYACKYEAKAKGLPTITLFEECGKYKTGQVIFNVQ